jgi:hypothetical protein
MAAGTPLHYAYFGLPRAVRFPMVRRWIFAGQLGFPIVAVFGWWTTNGFLSGFLRAVELEVLYVVIGCAIGWGIWRATGGSAPGPSLGTGQYRALAVTKSLPQSCRSRPAVS